MSDWHPDWAKNQHERRATVEETPDGNFLVRWSVDLNGWADVQAFEIVDRVDDGAPLFEGEHMTPATADAPANIYRVADPNESEPYLSGFVKWDGCSELDMGKQHWCGVNGFKNHCALLRYIWERAFSLMERDEDEPWDDQSMEEPNR